MSAPIKILHIIEQLAVGGTERQLLGLLPRLDGARFNSSVCYFREHPESFREEMTARGVPTVLVSKAGRSSMRFLGELRGAVKVFRPDVVHTWLYSANFWGRWAALSSGVAKLVASDRAEVRSAGPMVRLYERLLASRTLRLANSKAVADSLNRHYGICIPAEQVIYNAVDTPPSCDCEQARMEIRAELGVPADQKLVLMVGRQTFSKNYPLFLRVAQHVCEKRNGVTFVGVGGRHNASDVLDKMLDELNLRRHVRMAGTRSDVPRWLAAADVFCLTSEREGFPNALLEAMAAGLPAVCNGFGSAREIIDSPELGFIVGPDDEQAMALQVLALLDNPELAVTIGQRARRSVEARFSWDALVSRMETLYAKVAAESFPGCNALRADDGLPTEKAVGSRGKLR